jgi:hypothetical protein
MTMMTMKMKIEAQTAGASGMRGLFRR